MKDIDTNDKEKKASDIHGKDEVVASKRTAREIKALSDSISRLTKEIKSDNAYKEVIWEEVPNRKKEKSDIPAVDDLLANRMLKEFQNPNKRFFEMLEKMTVKDRAFRLKRLNTGVKPNTSHAFAVPVRYYAKILIELYGFESGSFWSKLSHKDKVFSEKELITREEVIALAFVYRLSSTRLNALLKCLGYSSLYPRGIAESAIIFCLDTYRKSKEFARFTDPSIELEKREFVSNYDLFYQIMLKQSRIDLSVMQSPFVGDLKKHLTDNSLNEKPNSLDTNKWFLSKKVLRKFIISSTIDENNLTIQCQKDLRKTINDVNTLQMYGNISFFTSFLNSGSDDNCSNRERFVCNREKSLRYVLKMMYRYLTSHSKLENGIRISTFFLDFTRFLNYLNLTKPSELFITEYIYEKKCDIFWDYNGFCEGFFHVDYNKLTPELKDKIKLLMCLYVKRTLNVKPQKNKNPDNEQNNKQENANAVEDLEKLVTSTELNECESAEINRIMKSQKAVTKNHYSNFRRILLGEADISRLMFILMYLFTFSSDINDLSFDDEIIANAFEEKALHVNSLSESKILNESNTGISYFLSDSGSLSELNHWLQSSGFSVLSEKESLKQFVEDYFEKKYDKIIFGVEKTGYLAYMLKYILLQDGSLQMLSKLHMSSYSLYTAEQVLLPKIIEGDISDESSGDQ